MNRAATYARTAVTNDAELDWQVQVLQGLAATLNLNVTHIIRETDCGLDFERAGLHELMGLVEQHEIDAILMTNLDRIGRDAPKVLTVLEALDNYSAKFIIQGGGTVEVNNPLYTLLHRFTPHPGLEVVLASYN